ncbi:MAG TPA: glycosyltransferase family 2 protein [Tepidisphaeraceae bacterium]|jgi:rhamnosyltransferase|nr:glycosyltransferase family 2 protein [Tepidisphaeraceae bacterium]
MPFTPNHPHPQVSIAILTRNGGPLFHRVIDSLISQQTDYPFEIVILDSASKDDTAPFAQSKRAKVVPYRPARFRFGAARDYLFEQTRGQIIVTISQDVLPASPDWLQTLVQPILDNTADATIGEQLPHPGGYAFYWDYHGSWLRTIPVRFDQKYGKLAISCANLAIRRSAWEKLRFGDCETIEDRVMQVKLFQNGHRMTQVKAALSYHGHDYTWKELNNRTESFAMGFARLGHPYTLRHILRDLAQPSRYAITAEAFLGKKLKTFKELTYPFAMCWMQYKGSRKGAHEVQRDQNYRLDEPDLRPQRAQPATS